MQWAMKLGLALDESRKTADSSESRCAFLGMTPPFVLELRSFGKCENSSNLGAHIFRSDYAIVSELAPQ